LEDIVSFVGPLVNFCEEIQRGKIVLWNSVGIYVNCLNIWHDFNSDMVFKEIMDLKEMLGSSIDFVF
jgi:hypothetical protein